MRQQNAGLRKVCGCSRRVWPKCKHPWHFNFKFKGTTYRFSLDRRIGHRIETKEEARKEADKIRVAIRNDTFDRTQKQPVAAAERITLSKLFAQYRKRHLTLNRPSTLKDTGYQIELIARTPLEHVNGNTIKFGEWILTDITIDTLEKFREARQSGGPSAPNRNLALLRAMFNWGVRVGYLERTPFKRGTETAVKLVREVPRSRRLDPGEDQRLLGACGPYLRAIIEAALETGCRKGELLSLQWSQVRSLPRAEIFLPAGKTKTRRDRRIPISSRLATVLAERLAGLRTTLDLAESADLPTDAHVFGNELGEPLRTFKRAWESAVLRAYGHSVSYVRHSESGIPDGTDKPKKRLSTALLTPECRQQLRAINLHFHDLRREAGSRWLEGGVPLHVVRDWLGHANISQTSTYLEGTIKGQHDAMRLFDERRGGLQQSATDSGSEHNSPPSSATKQIHETLVNTGDDQ